ncbi:Queuine tRNA-ribosyltransferase catalytic subunit 1 [Cucumispora dikerogammari]|nr:Queuine tRNA-ribosyltransferase catalytic subunit 1 [Cucumispora dikerogammari]
MQISDKIMEISTLSSNDKHIPEQECKEDVSEEKRLKIIKRCKDTRARVSVFTLNKGVVNLPCFMPVATYGALKATDPKDEQIILGNTFHLRELNRCISSFMQYNKPMLTDSGGFQMITLKNYVSEDGVLFELSKDYKKDKKDSIFFQHFLDPKPIIDESVCDVDYEDMKLNSSDDKIYLTPERSIEIQNVLNADIIMQLDDVVPPDSHRVEEACYRSIRWLDRCIVKKNLLKNKNLLFPIIQGGCSNELREISTTSIVDRIKQHNLKGVAIGGLCGGEKKDLFFTTIYETIKNINEKFGSDTLPKYVMGIGYPTDILLSIALGSDMSDCVYPTRTARFGNKFIDKSWNCDCNTCDYNEDYLKMLKGTTNYVILITHHNLYFLRKFTERIRNAILEDRFVNFVNNYFETNFNNEKEKYKMQWVKKVWELLGVKLEK